MVTKTRYADEYIPEKGDMFKAYLRGDSERFGHRRNPLRCTWRGVTDGQHAVEGSRYFMLKLADWYFEKVEDR